MNWMLPPEALLMPPAKVETEFNMMPPEMLPRELQPPTVEPPPKRTLEEIVMEKHDPLTTYGEGKGPEQQTLDVE